MTAPASFRYDVAFSFLSRDLSLAEDLAKQLAPSLGSFVYSRRKEEILGRDGMDRFASVFRLEARIAVILHRDGWGKTPWTAFEESHIRDRALVSRMNSFVIVSLDRSERPLWVPKSHLYASTDSETTSDILAIIRARAREEGATIRRATVAEAVLEERVRQEAKRAREERATSHRGLEEVQAEVVTLFAVIGQLVGEVNAADPTIVTVFGANGQECAIASSHFSTSVRWH